MILNKKKNIKIRNEFPIFKKKINGYPLIYFDNSSTTQKPKILIKKIKYYYFNLNSNVNRNNTFLNFKNSYYIKKCRKEIKKFINAKNYKEIIFTKSTTESINLISKSLDFFFKKNDEIIISILEHHSNILPWQILCFKKQLKLKILKINKKFNISIKKLKSKLSKKTKLIALTHVSNVFGTILPIKKIVEIVKNYNKDIIIVLDGAQSISHFKINVKKLNIDFYVFSAHKIYGPTGLGILYGKKKLLNKMKCYQYGGGMIKKYTYKKSYFLNIPNKFEAGTLNISAIFSFLYIIKYINKININYINIYENKITNYLKKKLLNNKKIILYNKNKINSTSIISFNIKNIYNYDIGNMLNNYSIYVRTGYHCALPLFKYLKLKGTIRISLGIYNNIEEIDKFYFFLLKIIKLLY
ncbi:MAG: aminotransferase class V-fold PLP-dependent enzyme [Candidatus Shikimatogenerans bostrichidophilus]|nr:MAG: aminotransferase class V-fold PLP-dependent enzyme [Candidatus Shikimatogenerans bostrichidophilus]WGH26634.1 MAG: aminotransferase class V-fold PLP-dependent enzyme [Candidatus Shikimatogenerans bostrichidophilus]